jgi:hypothetical protein
MAVKGWISTNVLPDFSGTMSAFSDLLQEEIPQRQNHRYTPPLSYIRYHYLHGKIIVTVVPRPGRLNIRNCPLFNWMTR